MFFRTPLRSIVNVWESLAPLMFPPSCCLCGEPTPMIRAGDDAKLTYPVFCTVCETSLVQTRPMLENACSQCGWPRGLRPSLAGSGVSGDAAIGAGLPCPRCARRKTEHAFSRITPLYRYQDTVTSAVVAAKYPRNSAITRELARRLAARCRQRWSDLPDRSADQDGVSHPIVTSVPSPWLRQARRGGSGTRLLARHFAAELSLPYRSWLRTTRSVAKQAWLDDDSRHENVKDAFAWQPPFGHRWGGGRNLIGEDVILVDDVLTTGATADEVTRILLDAGAVRVSVAVVALAMRDKNV